MGNDNEKDSDIIDWIIGKEDEVLGEVRNEVIKHAEYNFGEKGRKLAERYYRQMDGEEDFDDLDNESCDDCKERAKKLIEISEFIGKITEILLNDKFTHFIKEIDLSKINVSIISTESRYEEIIQKMFDKSLYDISDDEKKLFKIRVLLEFCKKVLP